jgi:hypothetical protein
MHEGPPSSPAARGRRLLLGLAGAVDSIVSERGQQGFPALSGPRLVWQDAGRGNDDISSALPPAGL